MSDKFSGQTLQGHWQWSVFQAVAAQLKNGELHLSALPTTSGAYLGTKVFAQNYTATALLCTDKSNSAAGVGFIGDDKNLISALFSDKKLTLYQLQDGKETSVVSLNLVVKDRLWIRGEVTNNTQIKFFYSVDGRNYKVLNETSVNGSFLPPWDRAVRAGIIARGATNEKAVFDSFDLISK